MVINPQVKDHNNLLGKEHWRAVCYYKTLLETAPFEVLISVVLEKEVSFTQKLNLRSLSQSSECTQFVYYFFANWMTNSAQISTALLFYAFVRDTPSEETGL